jgi:hypothetical protein
LFTSDNPSSPHPASSVKKSKTCRPKQIKHLPLLPKLPLRTACLSSLCIKAISANPGRRKSSKSTSVQKCALTGKEETTLLPPTTSCLPAPKSSKPTRNVTITSPSPVPRLLMTGRNLSSLPVRSLRSLHPSLTRLKGTKRILLPLSNRVDYLCPVWTSSVVSEWYLYILLRDSASLCRERSYIAFGKLCL